MIQLICTQCRAMLEMDDGFAGGACRCQHCGTIQTVPSHLKEKSKEKQSRTLYKTRPQTIAVPSSGLDQLADVVASSGITSSRLRTPPEVATAPPPHQQKMRKLLIAAAALIVVLSIALIFVLTRGGSPNIAEKVAAKTSVIPDAGGDKETPNFCGIALEGETIVYCLDRGDSARESFSNLKSATMRSIASLGADRRFQIVFWSNGKDEAYPSTWPAPANSSNISGAEHALDAISPHGKTDVRSALKKAIAGDPSEIVLVTAKAWDLDDGFVGAVDEVRGEKNVRIHTISLGDPRMSTALQTVAAKTRGTFKVCSEKELKEVVKLR